MGRAADMTDHELLHQYVHRGERDALDRLAARHLDWVYTAALRQVRGDVHLAEDVTQAVFLVLAKKAPSVARSGRPVGGWLFKACRYAAADARRKAARRARVESRAAEMKSETTTSGTDAHDEAAQWARLTPLLDESLARLRQSDRDAVILRYYQGKSHGEVGAALGVSEEAAKKRVARAVDKLGEMLRAKGASDLAPAALPALLATHVTGVAPAGLLAAASPAASAIAQAVLAGMTWTKLKLAGALAAMFVVAVPIGLLVTHAMGRDRAAAPRGEGPAAAAGIPPSVGGATTELVRWHVVVDASFAPAIEALGKHEPTTGKQVARRVAGEALLALIRKGMADGAVRVVPDRVKWLDPRYPFDSMSDIAHLGGNDDMTRDTRAYGLSGEYKLAQTPAGVTVSATYADPFGNLMDQRDASIAFNGTIADGQAVAFLGPESGSHDGRRHRTLLVLHAVACPADAAPFLRTLESGAKWFEGGPALALREARTGAERIAGAARGAAPASPRDAKRWTKTYSDGSTAQLIAVGEPAKRPHLWWDADGRPVKSDPFWHTATAGEGGCMTVIEFKPGRTPVGGTISSRSFAPVDLSTGTPRVQCGMGVGEWKTTGKVTVDQPLTAQDTTFKLIPITHYDYRSNVRPPYNTVVRVQHDAPRDLEVRVQLIAPDGKILGSTNGDWQPIAWRENLVMNQAIGYFNVKPADVKTAVVSTRKREWATVEGFALSPVEPATQPAGQP